MSSHGFAPGPNITAVSVANHCTGWATKCNLFPIRDVCVRHCSIPCREFDFKFQLWQGIGVAYGDRREGVVAKRRAIPSASKHNASCICPVCAVNYNDENEGQEWIQCSSSWFHEKCV
ncbi:hypothetical protein TNCV_4996561 [Trichonephila clavipes]|nr:hypothetical protein TNCV_4996561 [Trichonephila clavipes]